MKEAMLMWRKYGFSEGILRLDFFFFSLLEQHTLCVCADTNYSLPAGQIAWKKT